MINIYNELIKKISKSQILIDEQMSKHTSFKIGGLADFFIKIEKIEDLKYILKVVKENHIPLTIIGNGTNLLVKDRRNKGNCFKTMF